MKWGRLIALSFVTLALGCATAGPRLGYNSATHTLDDNNFQQTVIGQRDRAGNVHVEPTRQ
jgi:hypothetical protein